MKSPSDPPRCPLEAPVRYARRRIVAPSSNAQRRPPPLFLIAVLTLIGPFTSRAANLWTDVSSPLIQRLTNNGAKLDWPGGCSGVVVNRTNGDVTLKVVGLGLWQSSDRGVRWRRIDQNAVTGRDETGWATSVDPNQPGRMVSFSLDGAAGWTPDGVQWKPFTALGRNWDYGSVDWSDPRPRTIIAAKHETSPPGEVYTSNDGGTTWRQLSIHLAENRSRISMVGALGPELFIYSKGDGIHRSADGGASWVKVSPFQPQTRIPVSFEGVAYLGATNGLLSSRDQGASWQLQGAPVDIWQGPFFGRDAAEMLVVGKSGVHITRDAGRNWRLVADLKSKESGFLFTPNWFGCYAWDPVRNDLYASSMGNPVYRLALERNAEPTAIAPIEWTVLDPEATGYATFQSHNQKVVSNRRGFFTTHIRSRNEAYTAQQWRLSWSRDGGNSFQTIHEATDATNPPVIETDSNDNLYLVRPDFVDGHAYLYRFLATNEYRNPLISRIPNGSAGKYALILDRSRNQLCYFAHNNTFHWIGLDGVVRRSTQLLAAGPSAALQYPLLYLDAANTVHAAWTSQKHGVYLYWDIHSLQSPDGGGLWQTMSGRRVQPPVISDEHGPADRITLDDEFNVHTWLSSFLVQDGKAHFLYLAQTNPPRQHYVRYDLSTARRDIDLQPEFKGNRLSLRGLDGFFVADTSPNKTLYCIGRDANGELGRSRIACLASDDNGITWRDHAVSPTLANPYSIGGARTVTADGWIIGTFTDQTGSTADPSGGSKVYFFRIRTAPNGK